MMAAGTQIQHPDHSWVGYGKGYSGEGWALAFALRRVLVLRSDKIRTKIVGIYDATRLATLSHNSAMPACAGPLTPRHYKLKGTHGDWCASVHDR